MKKLSSLFLLAGVFLLVSCTVSAKNDTNKNNDNKEAKTKGEVVTLNKADFLTKVFNYEKNADEWVYEGSKPCIIDFYADWCGPCKKIAPVLKDLAAEYADDILVYKIDADKEQELVAAFGIKALPTLLFVPSDGVPMISQGALSRQQFVEQIDGFLLKK